MSEIPKGLKYTKDHEWVRIEGNIATVGITDFAQSELGDIVFAEVDCEVGDSMAQEDEIGSIESVKSVSEIYAPISGEIIEINTTIDDTPEALNEDPYNNGWLVKVKISDVSELDGLLSWEEYQGQIEN